MAAASLTIIEQACWLVFVAIMWGATNPLMKRGSAGVSNLPRRSHWITQVLFDFVFLFTRWQYVVPFIINILGSVAFYYSLANAGTTLLR
jgi:TRAP-type mannitol/chloroaromatic compound transport system permease small subunit